MMKPAKFWVILPGIVFFLFGIVFSVWAACEVKDYDTPEGYQRAIEECQKEIDARMGAYEKNKEDLSALEQSVTTTQSLISMRKCYPAQSP